MNIIAFGASYSKQSINKAFAHFTARQLDISQPYCIDLNAFALPIYTIDVEKEYGIPDAAKRFYDLIQSADLLVISMAEHNGSYTAAFKNLMDWVSRINKTFFGGKSVLLLSTSTGARGGKGVLDAALNRFPIHGANIIEHFSLPDFEKNFETGKGITNKALEEQFKNVLEITRKKTTNSIKQNTDSIVNERIKL